MTEPLRILVSRRRGGWGDLIACEPAIRAVRVRFGPHAFITWAIDDPYFPFFYDQKRLIHPSAGPDDVIWPDPWDVVVPVLEKEHNLHLKLDGPEMRHQLETDYKLTESRIENWVKYVDCMPDNMCPQWFPQPQERQKVTAWLAEAGIHPFKFILIQWQSAETKKDYPRVRQLVESFTDLGLKVVVCHHGKLPDMGVFTAIGWPFRELGCLAQVATLAIGPDSFLQHLAAAVNTPSLAIFGPTNPELYLKHYPLARFLWNTDVRGKPCEKTFPCFGLFARNWWCSKEPNQTSWCAGQISVKEVVDTACAYIKELRELNFYKQKVESIASGSTLFYIPDSRVNLTSLHHIQSTQVLGSRIRTPIPVQRQPC